MESKTSRYQSRILREMHQNTENPFNSPPSSTGSHGTVTLTSDLSYGPEGESTRRMEDDSIQLPALASRNVVRAAFNVNTSALGQNFPEWKGWNPNSREQTEDLHTGDYAKQGKENIRPPTSSTVASPTEVKQSDAQKQFKVSGGLRTRAEMQARVDNESDCADAHSGHTPRQQVNGSKRKSFNPNPRRGNVTTLIQTLKAAQAAKESSPRQSTRKSASPQVQASNRRSDINLDFSPATPNQTSRSFFLPNLSHIHDFVSGVLKFSTTKNGIPVFVKNGKVHDHELSDSPSHHFGIGAIEVPEDEQKIFVSMDKIREEIQTLQAHDDQVSHQAEQLQEEIYELQIQLSKLKSRKDSAMGSDSESSMVDHLNARNSQLEEQVAVLEAKLDKANRKISINEIHTETFVNERDEALRSATEHLEKANRLQAELDAVRRELSTGHGSRAQGSSAVETENRSLRDDNILVRQQYKSLIEENQSLRSHNTVVTQQNTELQQDIKRLQRLIESLRGDCDVVQKEYEVVTEEKRSLRQEYLSLERHNDKFYNDNKALQQKNALLERRVHDLQDNNAQLHQMLDVANAETGTMTVDVKDIRDRLQKKNRELSEENARLQQELLDLQTDFATKRIGFEQDKRRLIATNERLNDQIDQISRQFEQIIHESKEEATKYEEKQSSLTQQLQEIADRETALANQLKDSAAKESTLQQQIQRRTEAIEEARRITREIENLRTTAAKVKPVKVTRIVEPTASSKGKSVVHEISARSTATSQTDLPMPDDVTQQIDLTQGSDFGSIFPNREMGKLREALRQARADTLQDIQHEDITEEYAEDEGPVTEEMSQSLPPPFLSRVDRNDSLAIKMKPAASKEQSEASKGQPVGILKNVQQPRRVSEQDLTGRFSVKSGMTGMSLPSQMTRSDIYQSRRHSDSVRIDVGEDEEHEENMTSAFFMDDITLESRKRAAEKQKSKKTIPTLSKDAKRVLDSLCHDHDCRNCVVCIRINSHQHEDDATREVGIKKTVRVEQPIPVTDRIPNPDPTARDYEDQPTMRPVQTPGLALATVLKSLKDEIAHLKSKIAKMQAKYNELDPSFGKRQRKTLLSEIQQLMRMQEMKADQVYMLHDVLEGQKASGQQMSAKEVEVTINSIMSKDNETWDGIID